MSLRIPFNEDWVFFDGDINMPKNAWKGPIYTQAKTENKRLGPASVYYDDRPDDYGKPGYVLTAERWEKVTLPHDYMINQPMSEFNNPAGGFFDYHNAWYRKHFTLPKEYIDKKIEIEFGGIATECEIFVNGIFVRKNSSAFNPIIIDITDFVLFDRENVVAVYVSANQKECWWYAGGGIYRNVYLTVSEMVSVKRYGVKVTPKLVSDNKWSTPVEITVENYQFNPTTANVKASIVTFDGKVLASDENTLDLPIKTDKTTIFNFDIVNPNLWSVDAPNLYQVKVEVYVDGQLSDTRYERFGFRTIKFTANGEFFLNGKKTEINGVCGHEMFGLTGKAVPKNIVNYQVKLLKDMSANAYRCSHYMYSEEFMDAFDEQGLMVMAETRHFSTAKEHIDELKELVLRDRNRPSVIMWSIGNEEHLFIDERGRKIAETLTQVVKELDDTRPVMTANDKIPSQCTVYDTSDLVAINYNLDIYQTVRKQYPNKCFIASECCATSSTRGWYYNDCHEKGYLSAYDKNTNDWFVGRQNTYTKLDAMGFVAGAFQWDGIEHRGEAVWPRICSQAGAIDLFLQKKDAFYQNKSFWAKEPMVHLLPHWNMAGYGEPIKVWAYTNCKKVELFVNGKSFGVQEVSRFENGAWLVDFVPGTIKAVGYDENGNAVAEDVKTTSNKGYALKLRLENGFDLQPNGIDIAYYTCYVVDENGVEVPDACPTVSFVTDGAVIVGTGSDIADHELVKMSIRKMRAGVISVGVRVNKDAKEVKLYAESENLVRASITTKF